MSGYDALAEQVPPDDDGERQLLLDRAARWLPDLRAALDDVYPAGGAALLDRVMGIVAAAHAARSDALRARDRARLLAPDWFQRPDAIGYACYTDRMAGDLAGVAKRIAYLQELGVTYVHLMPLLQPRSGPNDGGYAVADYRSVRPDLGTIEDLAALAGTLHEHGISLTLDLVLNHVAREHAWAVAARAGDPKYRAYFRMFDRREGSADAPGPDDYERTLPEVFPDFAPGSFTWDDEAAAWVWTTFNTWQWDLDWTNPDVFCEFVDIVLFLANRGVDCLRLDAIAFIWKRLGTNCQNQPEVHAVTQALRAATRIAAPAMVFKAEAIVGPEDVVHYLGRGRHAGKVADLAYDNSLMVHLWSALAARDARLLVRSRRRFARKPTTTAWATYIRCHDDIGWAVDDVDAASVGWEGFWHRHFLSDFYAGITAGSFARGEVFQANPATGDRRISGTAASLAGVEAAVESGDQGALDLALGRVFLLHAVVYGFGGIPLLYMGDELGLTNDRAYLDDPAHADDNRWLHRPRMPWARVDERLDGRSVAGRVFTGIRHLADVRASLDSMHAAVESEVTETSNPAVFVVLRRHPAGTLAQLYNVSEAWQPLPWDEVAVTVGPTPYDVLNDHTPGPEDGAMVSLPPYAAWWLMPARP